MKRVLVTGAVGFTGQYIVAGLKSRGYDVIPLMHHSTSSKSVSCDLTDKRSVTSCLIKYKPNYIIHLAALSFVEHHEQKAFYDVNVFGCLNLLESAFELGISLDKIVLASSANIYGNSKEDSFISEDSHPEPVNHYAMSKLAMEFMVKKWFNKFPIIIARPFNYTGIGQRLEFLIPKVVNHFKNKKKIIELGNVNISRDFSDVRDIARYYIALMESDFHSDVVNLCSGKTHSLVNILDYMAEISGYEIKVEVNPLYVRSNDIMQLGGDNTKLIKNTNVFPLYSIVDTLTDMYNN